MAEGPEKKFQHHIERFLQQEHNYAVLEQAEITDTEYYFAEDHLYAFLQATQQDTLGRLEKDYSSDSRYEIFKALKEELQRQPLWCIFRNGLTVRGHVFKLYFPKPRSSESVANRYYQENRISFRPELVIKGGGKRPDIVFFLNGLPIITLELKHEKNENVHDAVTQYAKRDHNDRIFQLPFLHIAADTSEVMVATDPCQESNFRWYNTGLSNKAITEGEYPVEYLYREVLSKERLLEAVSFFLVLAPKQAAGDGKPEQPEFTLFPRYHQGRCVVKIADAISEHFVNDNNVGRKFLINHSAGSGKTLTMCWLRLPSYQTLKALAKNPGIFIIVANSSNQYSNNTPHASRKICAPWGVTFLWGAECGLTNPQRVTANRLRFYNLAGWRLLI